MVESRLLFFNYLDYCAATTTTKIVANTCLVNQLCRPWLFTTIYFTYEHQSDIIVKFVNLLARLSNLVSSFLFFRGDNVYWRQTAQPFYRWQRSLTQKNNFQRDKMQFWFEAFFYKLTKEWDKGLKRGWDTVILLRFKFGGKSQDLHFYIKYNHVKDFSNCLTEIYCRLLTNNLYWYLLILRVMTKHWPSL